MANITKTVPVTVTKVPPTAPETEEGYTIVVEPWMAKPAAGDLVTRIDWRFQGVVDSVLFREVSLDFGRPDNFVDAVNVGLAGRPHYVLSSDKFDPAVPATTLGSDVKDPEDIDAMNFQYIINMDLVIKETNKPDKPVHIEIDPGYRVWP